MAVLYVVEQGAKLSKQGDVLVVSKDGEELQRLPAMKVEQVVIFGNISLTTPVIAHLLQNGIDVVFLSSTGKYHGRLLSPESKFGELRERQFAAARDENRRLAIAKAIVQGKLANQRALLMRYARERTDPEMAATVEGMLKCIEAVDEAGNMEAVHGLEGRGSGLYFSAFKRILKQDMGFRSRIRRPPTDPVNSLLSFGYTLLAYALQAAVHVVGLDPYIGFLHTVHYGRPSLALDLMEEFRPVIVDSVVLKLVNSHMVGPDDFEQPPEADGAVLIGEEAKRRFLAEYESRVQARVVHPNLEIQVTYRRCFELQARHLARVITGEETRYIPFRIR